MKIADNIMLLTVMVLLVIGIFGIVDALFLRGDRRKEDIVKAYDTGIQKGIQMYRVDAVQRNLGEWVVDAEGNTEFRWKEK